MQGEFGTLLTAYGVDSTAYVYKCLFNSCILVTSLATPAEVLNFQDIK